MHKIIKKIKYLYIFLVFFSVNLTYAQVTNTTSLDSVGTAADSLKLADSTNVKAKKKQSIEFPVSYKADTIRFSVSKKTTYMYGNSKIIYGKINLTAANVEIDWNSNTIYAYAKQDTVDSLGFPSYIGIPHFEEKGSEPMEGLKLSYNFKTKRGKVWEGTTAMDPGYYRGVNIKKIGDKTLLIKEGYFSSCDNKNNPHFFFKSKKMWMRVSKKLIAKPIVLYIADIPIFYFPLVYMSLQKNRRSGIILPTYGKSTYGRYLRNFGYYWAMNDYMDMTLMSTYYDKGIFLYSGEMKYIKRYLLGGSIKADYTPKDINTGKRRDRYKINFKHSHDIKTLDIPGIRFLAPMSINASGTFQSDRTFNRDSYSNLNDRLAQELITTVNVRKTFTSINSSLNINFYQNKNLQNGNISRRFPQASFRLPSGNIGGKGKHWYGNINYNYNTSLTDNYSKKYQNDTTFVETNSRGWKHDISVRTSQKIFKYFSVSPNISFRELWVDEYKDYDWNDSTNTTTFMKRKGFKSRHTFNTSVTAKTTLYGLMEVPFGPLKLIRHKVDPSVSFNYTPDFSEEKYGYVQHFKDSTGNEVKRDIFAGNPYGATPTNKSQSIGLRLDNLFQGKFMKDGEEKKVDLLRWGLSSNYNMLSDSLKWRSINSNISTTIKWFKLSGSLNHSLYDFNSTGSGARNTFYFKNNGWPLRLLDANFRTGFSLNSSLFSKKEEEKAENKNKDEEDNEGTSKFLGNNNNNDDINSKKGNLNKLKNSSTSWQANFDLSYRYNRSSKEFKTKTLSMNSYLDFTLTKNWKLQYRANIDLVEKKIGYQTLTVLRDLHCWEMYFSWQPPGMSGGFSLFEFRINVKASALKDLKLTKHGRGSYIQ